MNNDNQDCNQLSGLHEMNQSDFCKLEDKMSEQNITTEANSYVLAYGSVVPAIRTFSQPRK